MKSSLLSLIFILASCFGNPHYKGGRIVGAQDFPYVVSLRLNGDHICGGSIISNNYILTSAACVTNLTSHELSIRAGSTNKDLGGSVFNVSEIIVHDEFDPNSTDFDYALLKLADEIEFSESVKPAYLVSDEPGNGTLVTISGWGSVTDGGSFSSMLHSADVFVKDREDCNENYEGKITERMICAAYPARDACQGDGGGPLVIKGTIMQVGISSWGTGCANPKYPGVYSNIKDQIDWIMEKAGIIVFDPQVLE